MKRFDHQRLQRLRVDLGLTQEAAAEATGVDVRTWRRFEQGKVNTTKGFSVRHQSRRQFLARLCAEFGVDDVEDWLVEMPSAGERSHRVVHPLQRARHFVGRSELMDRLRQWSRGDGPRVLALVALGGAGKTAVVERHLSACLADPEAPPCFVWSFYEDPQVERLVDAALSWLGQPRDAGLEGVLTAPGRRHWIFDGLEMVQAGGNDSQSTGECLDPTLRRWLRALARPRSASEPDQRALITSRLRPVDLDPWCPEGFEAVSVSPLSSDDAVALAKCYWPGLSDAERATLDTLEGHPLAVAMAGACGEALGSLQSVMDQLDHDLSTLSAEDALAARLTRVIDRYGAQLAPVERDALARIALMPRGTSLEQLMALTESEVVGGSLCGCSLSRVRSALRKLHHADLIYPLGNGGYSAHPHVRAVARRWCQAPTVVHRQLSDTLIRQLADRPFTEPDAEMLDQIEALVVHTRLSGAPQRAWQIYQRNLGGFSVLGLQMGEMLRGRRMLSDFLVEGWPHPYPEGLEAIDGALLLYNLALYCAASGDLNQAMSLYTAQRQHLSAAQLSDTPHNLLAVTSRAQAYTARLMDDPRRALGWLEESVERAARLDAPWHHAMALALSGAVHHDLGDVERGDHFFNAAVALTGRVPVARHGLWVAEARLAEGRVEEALSITRVNRETCAQRRWPGHVAHCDALIARCLMQVDRTAAWAHLEQAEAWVIHSREMEMDLRCKAVRARLHRLEGDDGLAQSIASLGLQAAEDGGFHRAARRLRGIFS
ncbi:MAG: helix-turn-helix domain-containing protein [Bradymonadia bacterium]